MARSATRPKDVLVGTTLAGKYRILQPLARGGMGRVYRALQIALEREVAIKILDLDEMAQMGAKDSAVEDFRRRFVLEAASAAKLTHPHTIVIHDYGTVDESLLYMVMELLDGRTFSEVIEHSAPMSAERVVRIMTQVCGSLTEAHSRGMVHRDLKPSNLMLTKRGADEDFIKVLDFGLVKKDGQTDMTQSGALIGTPRYMSPEQVAGNEVSPASDIYSLGACTYHALTGQPPFDSESKYVLMAAHMNVEPTPMREVSPDIEVPEALEAVVMRCLRKEPSERFASMEQVAQAMRESLGDEATVSNVTGFPAIPLGTMPDRNRVDSLSENRVRLPDAQVTPSPTPPPAKGVPRWLLLVLLAILAGAVAFFAFRSANPPGDTASLPASPVPAPSPEPEPEPVVVPSPEPAPPAAPTVAEVLIITEPEGATIEHEGVDLGNAPTTIAIPTGESWSLEVSARGYETRVVAVRAGQTEARILLERRRSGSRPSAMRANRMGAMAGDMTAPMATGGSMTDNRDPWAQ